MVILDVRVTEKSQVKLLKKSINRITKEILRETAEEFHRKILPRHFGPANRRKYKHEPRNKVYATDIKKRFGTGQGRFVDNQLNGRTKRRALAFARVTGTSKKATLRVQVPAYFNKPFVGTFRDDQGWTRRITRQPDKVAELKRVDNEDKEYLRKFADKLAQEKVDALKGASQRIING